MARPTPLLSLELRSPANSNPRTQDRSSEDDEDSPTKGFIHYLPLCLLVLLTLAPHPSLLIMLINYHLKTLNSPFRFGVHLLVTYTLTFCIFSSVIVCIARDPGPVAVDETSQEDEGGMDLTEALMAADHHDDLSAPGKFCRRCWTSKPERAHHCSICGRCVLKMDHHCVWLASKCIGHRTYPAFVHFLSSVTLLALYIAVISGSALLFAFNNPMAIDITTPVHELFLSFAGVVFSLVIGSFLLYHIYLISTNQTTLENLSPFLLLRYLPPLGTSHSGNSESLDEDRMSHGQRRAVRNAHQQIRLYDVGWRRNWAQIFGWNHKYGWMYRLWCGGGGKGDGRTFPRNPRSDEMLARLAAELMRLDKDV